MTYYSQLQSDINSKFEREARNCQKREEDFFNPMRTSSNVWTLMYVRGCTSHYKNIYLTKKHQSYRNFWYFSICQEDELSLDARCQEFYPKKPGGGIYPLLGQEINWQFLLFKFHDFTVQAMFYVEQKFLFSNS